MKYGSKMAAASAWAVLDWIIYFSLFIIGIYFILRDNILQKYLLERTNYARYEEPISERPTILMHIDSRTIRLKYGVDFNISYTEEWSGSLKNVILIPGQNKVSQDTSIEFEEVKIAMGA